MITMTLADLLVKEIIEEKIKLEKEGKHPRILIIGEEQHKILKEYWIEALRQLPWGDEVVENIEKRPSPDVFTGELCGLRVIQVDTLEGFEVR